MEAAPFFVPLLPILYRVFCPKRAASSFSRYPSCPPAARPEGFLLRFPDQAAGSGEKHSPGSLPLEGKVVSPSAKPDEVFFPAPQRSRKEAFPDVFPSSVKSFVSLAFVTCLACGGGGPYGGGRLWSAADGFLRRRASLLYDYVNLMFCTPSIIKFSAAVVERFPSFSQFYLHEKEAVRLLRHAGTVTPQRLFLCYFFLFIS